MIIEIKSDCRMFYMPNSKMDLAVVIEPKKESPILESGILCSEDVYTTIKAANARCNLALSVMVKSLTDNDLLWIFCNHIMQSDWRDGLSICEREIARRGLHVKDNTERFDL